MNYWFDPYSLLLIWSRFTLSSNLYVSQIAMTGMWFFDAMQPIIDVPIGAINAPLHKTYVDAKITLVTVLIKKFIMLINVYWHLIPYLHNLLTMLRPKYSGAESTTITLNYLFALWAFFKRSSTVCDSWLPYTKMTSSRLPNSFKPSVSNVSCAYMILSLINSSTDSIN